MQAPFSRRVVFWRCVDLWALIFKCLRLVVTFKSSRSTIVKTVFSSAVVEDLKHRGAEVTEWTVAEISVFSGLCVLIIP